jgi:hypothetical protein
MDATMTHICEMRLRNPANAEYEVADRQHLKQVPEEGSVIQISGGRRTRVAARYDPPKGQNAAFVLFLDPLKD